MANYVSKGYTTPTGVNSREDVRQWQQRLGVTADGIWGKNTQAAYRKWRLGGGTNSTGAKSSATLTSGTGNTKQKTTAQQKNSGSTSAGLRGLLGGIASGLTKGKTTANSLPAQKQSYAGMGVNGIGAQYAGAKATAKQNTATKKTVPQPQYEWPMHGLGVGGIGAKVNADTIAATQQQQAEERKKKTYQNPYANKHNNYGTMGGWRASMPVSEKPDPVEYTGGLGGIQYHIQQAQKAQEAEPKVAVLMDQSQLTEEKRAELKQEDKKPQFKLAETAHKTTGTDNYRKKEYEALVFWTQLPVEARQPGQGTDYFQPAAAYLEAENAELGQELRYWENLKLRGNPVLTKDADRMIESLRGDIEKNRKTLSKLIYILPEDIFRNEFGAKYADLLCLRTVDNEQAERIRDAREELKKVSIQCYNKGEYGRSAAADDIFMALEYKLPETAGVMGGINNLTLGALDYSRAYHASKEEGNPYENYLRQMGAIDAVSAANQNAYKAGEAVMDAISLAAAGAGIYKAGVRHFGDDVLQMIGENQYTRVWKETMEQLLEKNLNDTIAAGLGHAADELYSKN